MSPDPGNAGADLYNPQSWNGYAYVMNSPLSNVDPDGLDSCTATNCLSMGASPGQPGASGGGGFGFSFGWSFGGGSAPAVSSLSRPLPSLQFQDRGGNGFVNNLVDAESGAFDVLSFGLTEHLRNEDGIAAEVHKDTNWYTVGEVAGFGLSFLDGGELLTGGEALVDTNAIRFSQNSVVRTFKNGTTIEDAVIGLKSGAISPSDIPAIRIFVKDGAAYTLDNRRLVAASLARVKIKIRLATPEEIANEISTKFKPIQGGRYIKIRGVE